MHICFTTRYQLMLSTLEQHVIQHRPTSSQHIFLHIITAQTIIRLQIQVLYPPEFQCLYKLPHKQTQDRIIGHDFSDLHFLGYQLRQPFAVARQSHPIVQRFLYLLHIINSKQYPKIPQIPPHHLSIHHDFAITITNKN